MPLRIGVIGLGVIAKYYLAAAHRLPSVELAAVCDLRPETLAEHQVPSFRDHHELLAGVSLDAVVVTVPNDAHAAVCRDVLAAGLPVCVEKPLASSLADGRDLTGMARQWNLPLFTAFHRRYNDNVRALVGKVRGGARVDSVRVRYLERIEEHVGPDEWYLDPTRCGGGCVADNGPNAFDLVRLLLGEVTVTGAEIQRDRLGVDRYAVVELAAPDGARARVELDWSHPGETKDIEVRLVDGSVHQADLLAGHQEFKGSLWHEYAGVLHDFAATVATGDGAGLGGLAALSLVDSVYRTERRESR